MCVINPLVKNCFLIIAVRAILAGLQSSPCQVQGSEIACVTGKICRRETLFVFFRSNNISTMLGLHVRASSMTSFVLNDTSLDMCSRKTSWITRHTLRSLSTASTSLQMRQELSRQRNKRVVELFLQPSRWGRQSTTTAKVGRFHSGFFKFKLKTCIKTCRWKCTY